MTSDVDSLSANFADTNPTSISESEMDHKNSRLLKVIVVYPPAAKPY